MKYLGNFFCMNLARDLVAKFTELMPETEFIAQGNDEPSDYHKNLLDLKNGLVDFLVWPKEDFPGSVEAEYDYFTHEKASIVFLKTNKQLRHLRQAFAYPVSFVGAGPGEPEWITVEGLNYLKNCDVCFYDALVNPQILNNISPTAEKKYVGKRGDSASFDQSELNELIFKAVRDGRKVLRLKGGDAGILGRIQDEVDLLQEHELSWSISPGITAAQALAPCTGTYLTSRGVSDRVILTTARQAGGGLNQLMHFDRATLVIYMGILSIKKICSQLLEAGYPKDLPAMLAMNLGRSDCQELRGKLSNIAELAEQNNLRPPGLVVFGDTAGVKSFPSYSPLLGRRVLVVGGKNSQWQKEESFLRYCGAKPIYIEKVEDYNKQDLKFPEYDDVIFLDARAVYDFQGLFPKYQSEVNYVCLKEDISVSFECLYEQKAELVGSNLLASESLRQCISRDYLGALFTQ
ncbi:uroporphyrinogen-III C-methyltransferase [Lentisphaera profundi]|uniref:uroporphyrinogen-III C-methyltransferase n=1 Tax=Lentisphaera profundi TaxID=1658616 RepID=A0ABY7VU19_9BACT|nr:uroporphyrinogen-III C-methyltransferase [Lentisphaera profundi]WDE96809.1 uroporphyrinogen-III C-methyltransferase [Lentisphaera profundi]